jgi:hypothetical protein
LINGQLSAEKIIFVPATGDHSFLLRQRGPQRGN